MMKTTKPSFDEEKTLWKTGINLVIGMDEVGRGAFAGPIVAAAVVFKPYLEPTLLPQVNDSKLIKPQIRNKCAELIKETALYWTVEEIGIDFINKYGIGKANTAVFRKVLRSLIKKMGGEDKYFILIDGFHRKYLPGGIKKQKGIVNGDRKSYSIAAASILAKVHRDNLMKTASGGFPEYMFEQNKGYGTKDHRQALKDHGLSGFHRTSFNLFKFATI